MAQGLRETAYREKRRKVPLIFLGLALTLCALALAFPAQAKAAWRQAYRFCGLEDRFALQAEGSRLALHVLDVGKADCLLVESGGHFLLVDSGTPDRGPEIASYLRERGVERLDAAVNTHPDSDHIGGMAYVLEQSPAAVFYAPDLPASLLDDLEPSRALSAQMEAQGVEIRVPYNGERFALGSATVELIVPEELAGDTNNNSIVLRVTEGNAAFLLTGDAGEPEEQALLKSGVNLRADVLKVGHHGSATSSSAAFLARVHPKFAAISVADDASALPKESALIRLRDVGAQILRTDVSGHLLYLWDGGEITVCTSK